MVGCGTWVALVPDIVMRLLRDDQLRATLLEAGRAACASGPPSGVVFRPSDPQPFAYRRLREELEAHGAPTALVASARRAEIEELEALARVLRADGRRWTVPPPFEVRDLGSVAKDAAEAYVARAFEAATALALALGDEPVELACRRADLATSVLAWAWPLLASSEHVAVAEAVSRAVEGLGRVDPIAVALAREVFAPIAA